MDAREILKELRKILRVPEGCCILKHAKYLMEGKENTETVNEIYVGDNGEYKVRDKEVTIEDFNRNYLP